MTKLVGICGGIGSGKSFVSRILRTLGCGVYDCDLEARRIMDTSCGLKDAIAEALGRECVSADGSTLLRPVIASKVFSDSDARARLNGLVHAHVIDDIKCWKSRLENENVPLLFVESAILVTSGIAHLCDAVWRVTAPRSVRISRVMARSGLTENEVDARINAQSGELSALDAISSHIPVITIDNSPAAPLLSEVTRELDYLLK